MGRSGTQIVYYGNWKRLLQDEGCHKEYSINIENFNKVIEILNMKNPIHKILDFPEHLLKQYKDPFGSLPHMDRKKNPVIDSLKIFFCDYWPTNIFHHDTSRAPFLTIFKVSHTEGRLQQRRFDREIFFLAIRIIRRRNRQQSTKSSPSKKWIILEKYFKRNDFSLTTTVSTGHGDY
jgi:hypothetical protein